jgi:hypothetical protein
MPHSSFIFIGAVFLFVAASALARTHAADRDTLDGKVQPVIDEVDNICRQHMVYMIGPEKARRLAELVRQKKPGLVVECGTAIGYSGLWIARELNAAGRGKLITIEIDQERVRQAKANFEKAGLANVVKVRVGDARKLTSEIDGHLPLQLRGLRRVRLLVDRARQVGVQEAVLHRDQFRLPLRQRRRLPPLVWMQYHVNLAALSVVFAWILATAPSACGASNTPGSARACGSPR